MNTCTLLVRMQTGLATIESIMEVPQKCKVKLLYDSAVFSGYLPKKEKEKENQNSKRCMHFNVYCSVIYNNQHIETT